MNLRKMVQPAIDQLMRDFKPRHEVIGDECRIILEVRGNLTRSKTLKRGESMQFSVPIRIAEMGNRQVGELLMTLYWNGQILTKEDWKFIESEPDIFKIVGPEGENHD